MSPRHDPANASTLLVFVPGGRESMKNYIGPIACVLAALALCRYGATLFDLLDLLTWENRESAEITLESFPWTAVALIAFAVGAALSLLPGELRHSSRAGLAIAGTAAIVTACLLISSLHDADVQMSGFKVSVQIGGPDFLPGQARIWMKAAWAFALLLTGELACLLAPRREVKYRSGCLSYATAIVVACAAIALIAGTLRIGYLSASAFGSLGPGVPVPKMFACTDALYFTSRFTYSLLVYGFVGIGGARLLAAYRLQPVEKPAAAGRYQFSLRTMLVLATIVGMSLGWASVQLKWIRDRHAMSQWLQFVNQISGAPRNTLIVTQFRKWVFPPWSIRMFGETDTYGEVDFSKLDVSDDAKAREFERLFPEAVVVGWPSQHSG